MSKYERKADHQSAAMMIALASAPVFWSFIGALVLYEYYPVVSGILVLVGVAAWVRVYRFAGELGEENARKHRGNQ